MVRLMKNGVKMACLCILLYFSYGNSCHYSLIMDILKDLDLMKVPYDQKKCMTTL